MTATATAQIDTSLLYVASDIGNQSLSNLKTQALNPDFYPRRTCSQLQAAASGAALHRIATNQSGRSGRSRRSDGSPERLSKTGLVKATSISAVISNVNKIVSPKKSSGQASRGRPETVEPRLSDDAKERPKLVVPELLLPSDDSNSALDAAVPQPANPAVEKPAALATQCLVAKAHNELTLKAHVLKSFHELNSMGAAVVHPYNPLRAIRSRSMQSAVSPTTGKKPFLWNVAASELANDFAWRKVPVQDSALNSDQQGLSSLSLSPPLDTDKHSLSSGRSSTSNPSPDIRPRSMRLPSAAQHDPTSDELIEHLKAKYEHCRSDCSLIAGKDNSNKEDLTKSSSEMKPDLPRVVSSFSIKSAGALQRVKRQSKVSLSETDLSTNDLTSFRPTGIASDMEAARREAENTQNDLLYMLAVYDTINRRLERLADQQTHLALPLAETSLSKGLPLNAREDALASHLEKLGQFSETISKRSSLIESNLGRPAEVLRLESERLISEVNTTLSREVRELNAQLDKFETCQRAACLFHVGWNVLEWTVVVVLRLIWAIFSVIIIARKSIRALFF